MLLLRFRLPDQAEIDGLERNDDGVSGWAGIKGESGGSLEHVSSHFFIETSDVCAVITEAVDMWCRSDVVFWQMSKRLSNMVQASEAVPQATARDETA
jgi:hypothetical protein